MPKGWRLSTQCVQTHDIKITSLLFKNDVAIHDVIMTLSWLHGSAEHLKIESIAPHCWPSIYSSHKGPIMRKNVPRHDVCLMLFSVYELYYARVSVRHRATTSFRKTHVLYRFFKVSIFFFHGVGENIWPQPIRSSELGCLTSHSYATLNSVILEARSYTAHKKFMNTSTSVEYVASFILEGRYLENQIP